MRTVRTKRARGCDWLPGLYPEPSPDDPLPTIDRPDWRIIAGDCLDVLPTIGAGSVRLIFADPPYNIGIDYGDHHDDNMTPDAFRAWSEAWIRLCVPLLSDDGSMMVLINWEWDDMVKGLLRDSGLHWRQTIVWYESFGVNCSNKFNRCSRPMFHFVKDPKRFVFNRDAVTRPSDRQAIYNDKRANPNGKVWDDVWGVNPPIPRLAGTHKERIPNFPTQLPLALLRPIVGFASNAGDLVVDPFNGSGTTGEASLELGRRYIGIEMKPENVKRARERLARIHYGASLGFPM